MQDITDLKAAISGPIQVRFPSAKQGLQAISPERSTSTSVHLLRFFTIYA